ncbi:ABC transporter ATP-binding protein [Portibacter lacus]|uniref:ABC transporter ATP-binding protein n=1 Tax=Portibacter lacus TaxID=1099794 RepID=A0AA37WEE8_9BACT|nr:ABC transporter ATP-binding protein [Portibacter lacus]GLR16664.1 ABC transporter ATP-binding protein [Portibacter lacus]
MQQDLIYDISNLECQYIPGTTVLRIPELQIPKGKLVFVLGVSGIGKSTFIETLGLMNKTIHVTPETSIKFNNGNELEEIKNIWSRDNKALSKFRNDHFSFIFQNTNLMPNFSAGENMCISMLIEGKELAEVKEKVLEVMEKLNLDPDLYDRKIQELSGGQRQRLAFVRAIIAGFNVLFGDEPTGNLDRDTGHKLMRTLKENLAEFNRTGIIVSHDIDLALSFADIILLLSKKGEGDNVHGTFDSQYYLIKEDGEWKRKDGKPLADPLSLVSEILTR